jgi:hypothetical protein
MKSEYVYYLTVFLVIAVAVFALTVLAPRTRMRPGLLAAIGMVLVAGVTAAFVYAPVDQPSPASPRFEQRSGQSSAGKNDSTTGKDEGTRAHEILQTAEPLKITDEQRERIRDVLSRTAAPSSDSVNVSLSIGAAVPRQLELRPLPLELSDALHGYNGDAYFLVRDQMVIVDGQARRIVALIPGVR